MLPKKLSEHLIEYINIDFEMILTHVTYDPNPAGVRLTVIINDIPINLNCILCLVLIRRCCHGEYICRCGRRFFVQLIPVLFFLHRKKRCTMYDMNQVLLLSQ